MPMIFKKMPKFPYMIGMDGRMGLAMRFGFLLMLFLEYEPWEALRIIPVVEKVGNQIGKHAQD